MLTYYIIEIICVPDTCLWSVLCSGILLSCLFVCSGTLANGRFMLLISVVYDVEGIQPCLCEVDSVVSGGIVDSIGRDAIMLVTSASPLKLK